MGSRSKRPRVLRRESARRAQKLAQQREKLFRLARGGSPERPLVVESTAVIEAKAADMACPRCDGQHRVQDHLARKLDHQRLREVQVQCRYCGTTRSVWFRLEQALLH